MWGHLLIPVLLGTLVWGFCGIWIGYEFIYWLTFASGMLVMGWLLTIVSWVRFYLELHNIKQRNLERLTDSRDL